GPNLVRAGDTTAEVLIECGSPTYKEVTRIETEKGYRETFPYGGTFGEVSQIVETWYYNCGPHRFIKILTFRGGLLKSIDTGDYGSGESDCVGAKKRKIHDDTRPYAGETEESRASSSLAYGRISIFGFPHFARVYLDGKLVGDVPSTLEFVEPGKHDLKVTREGYEDWEKRVIVKSGETIHLEVNLDLVW
ncbi:MAG: DUF2845 domain-containing protein, partial [Planctomycetota bacterium]